MPYIMANALKEHIIIMEKKLVIVTHWVLYRMLIVISRNPRYKI